MKVTYTQGPDGLTFVARRFMGPLVLAGLYTHVYRSMGLDPGQVDFDELKPAQRTLARKMARATARGYILCETLSSPQGSWALDHAPDFEVDLSTWDMEALITLRFHNPEHAMLFKLTWLGVEA